jgi:hypothetical protein
MQISIASNFHTLVLASRNDFLKKIILFVCVSCHLIVRKKVPFYIYVIIYRILIYRILDSQVLIQSFITYYYYLF